MSGWSEIPNPIIPGTTQDRTGAARLTRKAIAEIDARYAGLEDEVLAAFNRIPVYAVNALDDKVLYGMTPEQLTAFTLELQASLERWIASSKDPAHQFWWSGYVDDASQLGAAQSVANLTNLSEVYGASRSLATVIYSTPYKTRLAMAQIKSYEHWTGLAAQQKSDLAQIVGRAVVDGKNPKAVEADIMKSLSVSKSRATGYAQTDIGDTLREAKLAEADYASESLNIKVAMLWASALIATTRPTHGSKNGKVFSTAEVKAFYAKDGNRFRCRCGQVECLLDTDGKPILTDKLKAKMALERENWEKTQK